MEIHQNLLKYKLQIITALILSLLVTSIVYLAPRVVTILAYFWPLFISTGIFLGASFFIGKTSLLATDSDHSADKTSEVLLDYVVGQPPSLHAPDDSFKSTHSQHDNHT
ncbi:hypothetical protein LINGRAHAP2_LOCUS10620 [Linum grandiflorum]